MITRSYCTLPAANFIQTSMLHLRRQDCLSTLMRPVWEVGDCSVANYTRVDGTVVTSTLLTSSAAML